ncbi:mechanosensitive ion channel family protein [Halegenticoccus soli]|uniref:mechanosensitive ion channel family protein n=1 Tax=Halegenticoccus soli TaxID=1985678 RepID=UPI000C6DC011|nr:mechanosensitive ion channel family protein [Halegenticoccus soli]
MDSVAQTGTVESLRATYFATFEGKLLASAALTLGVVCVIWAVRRGGDRFRTRYGANVTEAVQTVLVTGIVVCAIGALAVVWNVEFVVRLVLEAVAVGRLTLMQQLTTVAVFLVAYLLVRFLNRSIDELARTGAITNHQSEIAYHVADVGVFLGAASVVLSVWGVDLTSAFISAGVLSVILGLAARATLAGMIAGFVLLFSRPFEVGDWIEVNDRTGIVTDVTIFNTKIQTFRDEHVMIPNDEITSSQVTNFSKNNQLRVEIAVGVDYETDLERARSVLESAAEGVEMVKSSPSPRAIVREFGSSAVEMELRVWIREPTMRRRWTAKTATIEAIKASFDREGIAIPYPRRVHEFRGEGDARIGPRDFHP